MSDRTTSITIDISIDYCKRSTVLPGERDVMGQLLVTEGQIHVWPDDYFYHGNLTPEESRRVALQLIPKCHTCASWSERRCVVWNRILFGDPNQCFCFRHSDLMAANSLVKPL